MPKYYGTKQAKAAHQVEMAIMSMILGKSHQSHHESIDLLLICTDFISFPSKMCSQFTRITTIEQRRKYKTEFDNDYAEYMRLHADTERVSKRFAYLEESLKNETNNDQRYKVSFWGFSHRAYAIAHVYWRIPNWPTYHMFV